MANEGSKREHVEEQILALHEVTSANDAYNILEETFTPPTHMDDESYATWTYHTERTRRQMVGSVLGEFAARSTVERLNDHLTEYGNVTIAATEEHPIRSASLQDFVATMNHWFTDAVTEVTHTNPVAKLVVEAGNRRRPLFRDAVANWLVFQHARGKNLQWELPSIESDAGDDIANAYGLNMANEVPNQFLIFGLDPAHIGAEQLGDQVAQLAHSRLSGLPAFTSAVHGISAPVMGPFVTYDPITGVNEHHKHKDTPQTLYSAWERDPTPENARAFLALAGDPDVKENLARVASLPGAGPDGRSRNPGHCHIDMRIVNEAAFPVRPRQLLYKLGEYGLAQTRYLNISTLVSAVGFNAAQHTLYSHWPDAQTS